MRSIKFKFGDGKTPQTIDAKTIRVLTAVAKDKDLLTDGVIDPNKCLITGKVYKETLAQSLIYLLELLGLEVSCGHAMQDSYYFLDASVDEGNSVTIQLSSETVDIHNIVFDSPDKWVWGNAPDSISLDVIKSRCSLVDNVFTVESAKENATWTTSVTITGHPTYDPTNTQEFTVNISAVGVESIKVGGDDLVTGGSTAAFSAVIVPSTHTKAASAITFNSNCGEWINANTWKAPKDGRADAIITATVSLYGNQIVTQKKITIDVPILNDTDLNPKMFGVIKSALGLTVNELSVSDLGNFTNSDVAKIFNYMTNNSISTESDPLYFEEFQYFTGCDRVETSSRNNVVWMKKIKFPSTLTYFLLKYNLYGLDELDFSPCKNIEIRSLESRSDYVSSYGCLAYNPKKVNLSTATSGQFCILADLPYEEFIPPKMWTGGYCNISYLNTGTLDISQTQLSTEGNFEYFAPNVDTVNFNSKAIHHCGIRNSEKLKYIMWDNDETTKSTEIPDWMETIETRLFAGCTGLQITGFNNATAIHLGAFLGCISLNKVDFNKVTSVGDKAFRGCTNLTCDNFGAITSVGSDAFNGCVSLDNTSLDNIKTVDTGGFAGCSNLQVTDISKLTLANREAFYNCISCTFDSNFSNDLKKHLVSTDIHYVFKNCYSAFPSGEVTIAYKDSLGAIWNVADSWSGTLVKKIVLDGGPLVTTLYLRDGDSDIKILDIRKLTLLNSINAPYNVVELYEGLLFFNLTNVNKVCTLGKTPSWLFPTDMPVYVPDNLVDLYKAATNWSAIADNIFGLTQFKADAVANGWGTVDSDNNWIQEPEDMKL